MNQIECVECFKNCTKLCKPHESNKAMWDIYNLSKEERQKLVLDQESIRQKIKHPDFI